MAAKRFVVVDETIGLVISHPMTEKQAQSFMDANGSASHTFSLRPAADVAEPFADSEVDPPDDA